MGSQSKTAKKKSIMPHLEEEENELMSGPREEAVKKEAMVVGLSVVHQTKPKRKGKQQAYGGSRRPDDCESCSGRSGLSVITAGMTVCPCCNRRLGTRQDPRQTVDQSSSQNLRGSGGKARMRRLDRVEEWRRDSDVLGGILEEGSQYSILNTLVEGWLHQKEEQEDPQHEFKKRRVWKPRWLRLALANVAGYDVNVPVLLIASDPDSKVPRPTLVTLDSMVVMPVDIPDKSKWSAHRFQIRRVKSSKDAAAKVMREFTAPKEERNAWVYAINQMLLSFEKEKNANTTNRGVDRPLPSFNSVWSGDQFLTTQERDIMSRLKSGMPVRWSAPPRGSGRHCPIPIPRPSSMSDEILTESEGRDERDYYVTC